MVGVCGGSSFLSRGLGSKRENNFTGGGLDFWGRRFLVLGEGPGSSRVTGT